MRLRQLWSWIQRLLSGQMRDDALLELSRAQARQATIESRLKQLDRMRDLYRARGQT